MENQEIQNPKSGTGTAMGANWETLKTLEKSK